MAQTADVFTPIASASAPSDSSESLLKVQVDLVLVPVTVTDALSRPVVDLRRQDFTLYENREPQQIRYFSLEQSPISVGLLLDLSGTMKNKIGGIREALHAFVQNSNANDDFFAITFADKPQLLVDSGRSIEDLDQRLESATGKGHTALLDAVHMGLQKLRSATYQRRALLIISDGNDNWSRHRAREVEKEIAESGVDVYALGLFDDVVPILDAFESSFGKRLLSKLTGASGGCAMFVNSLQKLPASAAEISLKMRTQYMLGYKPIAPGQGGESRTVKVTVNSNFTPASTGPFHLDYKKTYLVPRD